MKCEDIIKEISLLTGVFPQQAMVEAVQQQDEITPLLLAELRRGAEQQEEVAQEADNVGYIFAMYLLAQFREPAAYVPLLAFFSTPGDLARQMTGDIITEGLGQLLAAVYGGDVASLKALIGNEEIDQFVRGAGLEALLCLLAWQELKAEDLSGYLHELATTGLSRQPSHVWNYLVEAAIQFCPHDFWPVVAQAYDDGLVSELYIARQDAENALQRPVQERLLTLMENPGLQPISSALDEMKGWACFHPERTVVHEVPPAQPVRVENRAGRNDPCPCGSGKKYKKCCLRK